MLLCRSPFLQFSPPPLPLKLGKSNHFFNILVLPMSHFKIKLLPVTSLLIWTDFLHNTIIIKHWFILQNFRFLYKTIRIRVDWKCDEQGFQMNRASLVNHNKKISPGFLFLLQILMIFFENITDVILKAKFVIFQSIF